MLNKLKFAHKIIFVAGGLLAFALVSTTVINYLMLKQTTQQNLDSSISEITHSVSGNIANWLNGKLQIIEAVASAASKTSDKAQILAIVQLGDSAGDFKNAYVGLEAGDFILDDSAVQATLPAGFDPRGRPWYIQVKSSRQSSFTDPYIDVTINTHIISAVAPVQASGQFIGVAGGDMTVLDGFITNVSNYTPTEEIFLPDPEFDFDGNYIGIKSSSYYEWNPVFDEKDFAESLHASFVAQGFPEKLGMIIDTSRNGWGADDRPGGANDNAANENQYVIDSKLDRRKHRGNWCNASGAGIGARPQSLPYGNNSVIDAFVWIKPPGESDGTSDETQTEPDDEGKSFDAMCSPDHITSGGVLTGAMADAPSAGAWFPAQFKMLVENAYPAL